MATDITIQMEDRPGELARLGETLGAAGINILGFAATRIEGVGEIHLLVEDAAAARESLRGAGIQVSSEREMVVLPVEERPGELGRVARTLAEAGLNIELGYAAEAGLAFGVDDPERARELE
jgi:hypothetical protein